PQVQDQSIGLSDGQWRLLAAPTPGGANAAPAVLGPVNMLRFNEWMANPANGPDWLELYNAASAPVDLAGLRLTDDLSASGTNQFVIPRLSFVGPGGFVSWIADGEIRDGRNHLSFSLDAQGEGLRLYSTNGGSILDTVVFGPQLRGVSEGRLPDGSSNVVRFPGSATPAAANYLPIPDLVINEVLPYAEPPLEQAVELHNAGVAPLSIGGWFLSDSQANFKKYRLPDGATIAQGGYWVLYQDQFGAGPTPVTFHPSADNEIGISAADSAGNLTGYRLVARVGPALSGVSFGRHPTSVGIDYPALSSRSFGQDAPASVADFRLGTGLANADPQVGPVVI